MMRRTVFIVALLIFFIVGLVSAVASQEASQAPASQPTPVASSAPAATQQDVKTQNQKDAEAIRTMIKTLSDTVNAMLKNAEEKYRRAQDELNVLQLQLQRTQNEKPWTEKLVSQNQKIAGTVENLNFLRDASQEQKPGQDILVSSEQFDQVLFGRVPDKAAWSCSDIISKNVKATTGTYFINTLPYIGRSYQQQDKNAEVYKGVPKQLPMPVHCDMKTEGGGWTRFAIKGMNYAKPQSGTFFDKDINKDTVGSAVEPRPTQLNQLNLKHFDQFLQTWEVLVHIIGEGKDATVKVTPLLNNKLKPSDAAAKFAKAWTIPKGAKCVDIDLALQACRVGDDAALADVDAWSEKVSSFWMIRKQGILTTTTAQFI